MGENETDNGGTGKVVWWLMGMLAVIVTASILGWVSRAEARFEHLNETTSDAKASIDLLRYRLDEMEKAQRETNVAVQETNENTKAMRQLLERRR